VIRRRTLLYVLLALAVPFPALALTGGGPGSPGFAVGASLDSCGTAADQIVCKIDASWNSVPEATRYAARVTSPDGSVIDYGDVGAGGTSFWVPYVGNGTYTVTVAAYGTKRGSGEPELLAKSSSDAGGKSNARRIAPATGEAGVADEVPASDGAASDPGGEPTDPADPTCDEEPEEVEEPPTEEDDTADTDAAPEAGQAAAAAADTGATAADDEADEAEAPDCPVPSATP
jgi:phage baseplate assembly protein gpV